MNNEQEQTTLNSIDEDLENQPELAVHEAVQASEERFRELELGAEAFNSMVNGLDGYQQLQNETLDIRGTLSPQDYQHYADHQVAAIDGAAIAGTAVIMGAGRVQQSIQNGLEQREAHLQAQAELPNSPDLEYENEIYSEVLENDIAQYNEWTAPPAEHEIESTSLSDDYLSPQLDSDLESHQNYSSDLAEPTLDADFSIQD